MDLLQREAVVGRAVADLLAVEVLEGQFHKLPAFKVVGDVNAPALGVVPGGVGRAVFLHIHKEGAAGGVAIEPHAQAHIAAPILADPLVPGLVHEGVGEAGPTAVADGRIQLEDMVVAGLIGQGQSVLGGNGDIFNGDRTAVAPGDEAHVHRSRCTRGQGAALKIVHPIRATAGFLGHGRGFHCCGRFAAVQHLERLGLRAGQAIAIGEEGRITAARSRFGRAER